MVPSSDGGGYFMVASDGGVFAFGDARFAGSCPGIGGCSGAAVAVVPDASGNGYWLATQNGNVYAFGDAPFYGAPGNQGSPVTSAVRTADGGGYWVLLADGAVYATGTPCHAAVRWARSGASTRHRPSSPTLTVEGTGSPPPTVPSSPTATPRTTVPWRAAISTAPSSPPPVSDGPLTGLPACLPAASGAAAAAAAAAGGSEGGDAALQRHDAGRLGGRRCSG